MSIRKKIGIVATTATPLVAFMKPHVFKLREDYDLTLIANADEQEVKALLGEHTRFIRVGIERKIDLVQDISALFRLFLVFRQERFDVVQSLMPKAGLLAMLAAFAARVPHRIHFFTGQVWANKKGIVRWGLKFLDKVVVFCATALMTDCFSQKDFLVAEKVVAEKWISVLGHGPIGGVDVYRFKPNSEFRNQIRQEMNIPQNAIVFIFVGRLNKEKGIFDLINAFISVVPTLPDVHLIIVGEDEENLSPQIESQTRQISARVHNIGFSPNPEKYMSASDILCLPSYREGFGAVIVEAAAVGLPSIVSDIYGLHDAVVANETGLFHAAGNVAKIKDSMIKLATNDGLRTKMAQKARHRALQYFTTASVVAAMDAYYKRMLSGDVKSA